MPRENFDETNEDLCLVFQALQGSLKEICGGDIPLLQANPQDYSSPLHHELQQSNVTASVWPEVLRDTCRSSINATSINPLENLGEKPWDIEVRTVASLFNRFTKRKNQAKRAKEKKLQKEPLFCSTAPDSSKKDVSLVLISDLGVSRTVHSSVAWASLVLPRMEERLPEGWRGSISIAGFILWVSPRRAAALYEKAGRRPCASCPAWPKGGEKGLWWHTQEQHSQHHASATAWAASTRNTRAVMVYTPPSQSIHDMLTSHMNDKNIGDENTPNDREALLSDKDRLALAFEYAANGNLSGLRRAISEGWVDPVNDIDMRGATLLLWGAGGGHLHTVQYLIEECGCDARKPQQQVRRGFAGRTALHWACRKGHLPIVQYILQKCGPEALEDRTADGTTAVGWCAWQGQQDILEYLLREYACDMLTVNKFGCNALLWAAQGTATPSTMEWLVEVARCPLTHKNGNGHGILHKAAQRNRPEIAQWLHEYILRHWENEQFTLEMFEDFLGLLGPDREGCTPSDLAGIEGHERLAEQVKASERLIWEKALERFEKDLSFPYEVDPAVVSDDYGPGCGVARLWGLYSGATAAV